MSSFIWARRFWRFDGKAVTLSSGTVIDADFAVLGVGAQQAVALAERAGLDDPDRRYLGPMSTAETSVQGVFAAGDVARWPRSSLGGFWVSR